MDLTFEMDVTFADTAERTVEGVIVPYGETATIRGKRYRFRPGSIRAARARTPLLLDHDRARPVGVLVELAEHEDGARGIFRIDATSAGDEALAQAASGSRGAFSIGATVEAGDELDGVLEITGGLVHEVSLLALGAFAGAGVERVAAEQDEPDEPEQTELETPAPPADPPEEETPMEASHEAAPMILAAHDRPARELSAGELVGYLIRAQHGERDAIAYLEAALTETISTDVTGLLPPQYEKSVMGGRDVARPLYNAFRSRPLPGVGLAINKPKWTAPPAGAWAANVDADATSTKVTIGSQAANVERWDWAGAISWVVVQRSDPSIVDEIYAEAVQDFYLDVEAKIYAKLGAAAAGTSTKLGAAIAEFFTASAGKTPNIIFMAADVWGKFADAGALAQPVAAGGASASGELTSSFGGIPAVISGNLAAGQAILATRRAVDARITEPVRLTANAIGALNLELAVVAEGLFDTDYPAELMKFAAVVPGSLETRAVK